MNIFTHKLTAFAATLALTATMTAEAASFDIAINDVTTNNASVTVTPADSEASYVTNVMLKSEVDQLGGVEKIIDKRVSTWKTYGEWYNCSWLDFLDQELCYGIKQYSADESISIVWDSEYVAYAFGMDEEGNRTAPIEAVTFRTAKGEPSDNTFKIEITSIEEYGDSRGRLLANVAVTPSNNDDYVIYYLPAAELDDVEPGSDAEKEVIVDQVLWNVNRSNVVSGQQTATFKYLTPGKDYYIVAMGVDSDMLPTTPLERLRFAAQMKTDDAAFDFTIANITAKDATITVTPVDPEATYITNVMTKAELQTLGGVEKIIENRIATWTRNAGYYAGMTWQDMMKDHQKKGVEEYQLDDITFALWDTDYIVYAFGMDDEGNVTAPVTTATFRTDRGAISNNGFSIKLNSIEEYGDSRGRLRANATVVTDNNDDYIIYYVTKNALAGVEPGSDAEKQVISDEVLYYNRKSDVRNGEQDYTFQGLTPGNEYYIVALGVDEDMIPSTPMERLLFKAEVMQAPVENRPTIELSVSEVTSGDAYISIKPSDPDMLYYFYVSMTDNILRKGTYEDIPTTMIIEWWQYIAGFYTDGTVWQDFIPLQCNKGGVEGYVSDLSAQGFLEDLVWDTDYTLYAVGFDLKGRVLTDAHYVNFRTGTPEKTDLTFEFEPFSVEDDPQNSWGSRMAHKVTIDVYPSGDEPFAINFMETRFYDQYLTQDEPDMLDFVTRQFMPDCKPFTGPVRLVMPGILEGREYYLVAMGWNGGPTTDINLYKFDHNIMTTRVEHVDSGNAVKVNAADGAISLEGEYDFASVYSLDGKLVGTLRDNMKINVAAGVYIVNYVADGITTSTKVVVK